MDLQTVNIVKRRLDKRLTVKQAIATVMYLGLNGIEPMAVGEIAKELNLSQARVTQLLNAAEKNLGVKIRH